MRRKDRELTVDKGLEIIDKAEFGVMSINDENEPYTVALSIVREGNIIYFHCAKMGKKLDLISKDNRVSILFTTDVKVPKKYTKEELNKFIEEGNVGVIISKVYTTEYSSALVRGIVSRVEKDEDKIKALKLICEKYTKDMMEYFDLAIEKSLLATDVYKVEIKEVTAKSKKV